MEVPEIRRLSTLAAAGKPPGASRRRVSDQWRTTAATAKKTTGPALGADPG